MFNNGNNGGNMNNNYGQGNNNQNDRPNIWWKPVSQKDYGTLAQMGEAVFTIRILPGYANNSIHEAIFEKDVSATQFPNTKKWLAPVWVLNDPLHPENNGRIAVMEMSKTLHKNIKNQTTPQNYFDPNNGHNFNIVVELQEMKGDSESVFPNYYKSHFDQNPTQIDIRAAFTQMQNLGFLDFSDWVGTLNAGLRKKAMNNQQSFNPQQSFNMNGGMANQSVNPQSVAPQQPYSPTQNVPQPQPQPQVPQQNMQPQPVQQPVQQRMPQQ